MMMWFPTTTRSVRFPSVQCRPEVGRAICLTFCVSVDRMCVSPVGVGFSSQTQERGCIRQAVRQCVLPLCPRPTITKATRFIVTRERGMFEQCFVSERKATPRYVEQFGAGGIGFTFMDHKGTRFHADLGHCRLDGSLS